MFTNEKGVFQFDELAPGNYAVTMTETMRFGMRSFTSNSLEVAPDKSQQTVADLTRGEARLTIQVVGPNGESIPADVYWFSSAEAGLPGFDLPIASTPGHKVGQGAPDGTAVLNQLGLGNATLCAVADPGITCRSFSVKAGANQETTLAFRGD